MFVIIAWRHCIGCYRMFTKRFLENVAILIYQIIILVQKCGRRKKRVGLIMHVGSCVGLFLLMNDVYAISIGGSVICLPGLAKKCMKITGQMKSINERFRCDFVILIRQVLQHQQRKNCVDSGFYDAKADGDFWKIIYGTIWHERQQLNQLFNQAKTDKLSSPSFHENFWR